MPIIKGNGWDSPNNHRGHLDWNSIVTTIQMVAGIPSLAKSAVGKALQDNSEIVVVKGIHDDRIGAHITVETGMETYHIYLTPKAYNSKQFVWTPAIVCTGGEALSGDVNRTAYHTGDAVYRVEASHHV